MGLRGADTMSPMPDRAASMRLELPAERSWRQILEAELRAMQARLN